jgi:hypothetical protein
VEALWRLSLFKFDDNPGQVPFAKHAGPFQWPAWLYSVSKNRSCQGLPKTSQKLQSLRHLVCSNIFSHLLGCPTPHIGCYDDASPFHASPFDRSHWMMGPYTMSPFVMMGPIFMLCFFEGTNRTCLILSQEKSQFFLLII